MKIRIWELCLIPQPAFGCRVGGDRSPDVAWVEKSRWEALLPDLRRKFPPVCPDFMLELRSPSDNPKTIRAKMQEYLSCGAKLD